MHKKILKNRVILLFIFSSSILYVHELYRLFLGCPRVLGECYLEGADRFLIVKFIATLFLFFSLTILLLKAIKNLYVFLKGLVFKVFLKNNSKQ